MKIQVKQAKIVKPAEETPIHSLWLSNLDLIQVRFHMGILYFYNPCSSYNLPNTRSLIDALSKVLVLFYPAAGRLQKDKNGRLEIRCNGEKVLLVEAETDSTIQDIGLLTQGLDLSQLVPALTYSGDISSLPLLLFQFFAHRTLPLLYFHILNTNHLLLTILHDILGLQIKS
ncbi:shikimate O-hydroxycinnamoyltransferase-like isoform X2 [Raphanus sativus]|uniref:Shikimate O-hydroxycinnamoyltransferase-like isoform X2 n=1 Tax=Raphanus sativus TaxID=3726 RepID=A0A9W3DBE9_RAPSA|nr:shikimate O-hydroxycinnamoyltransferase-like isoform X2 [Raphanus sativus]